MLKTKMFAKLTAMVSMLLVVAMVLSGCGGYSGTGEKAIKAYLDGDAVAIAELQEEYYYYNAVVAGEEDDYEWDVDEVAEKWESKIENFQEALEKHFDADFEDISLDYEITESEDISDLDDDEQEAFEEMADKMDDEYDISVSDAANIEFEITAECDGEDVVIDGSVSLLKVDGDWVVNSLYVDYYELEDNSEE